MCISRLIFITVDCYGPPKNLPEFIGQYYKNSETKITATDSVSLPYLFNEYFFVSNILPIVFCLDLFLGKDIYFHFSWHGTDKRSPVLYPLDC